MIIKEEKEEEERKGGRKNNKKTTAVRTFCQSYKETRTQRLLKNNRRKTHY